MRALTGLDLPAGSPGGSVELLADLYLGTAPLVDADAFMLAPATPMPATSPERAGAAPILLDVPGKQLDGEGFWNYVADLAEVVGHRFTAADYDVLHLQHLAFGATPALLRAFPGHPCVALVHGTDVLFAADHPTQAEVLRQTAETADMVVVPTTAMSARLRRFTDIPAKRIAHIPWGIPDHLLTAPADRQLGRQGAFRVLYAGRLTAEKAPAELFQALAELDGVELTVAAPESEYAALTARAELSRVHHLGWLSRPRLWSEFYRHDLLVVPSTRLEAFGLVAVEAQARGLPVLYRPVDGLTEVLGGSAQAVSANGGGSVPAAVQRLRRDPHALADLRARGLVNAARFPLSQTARLLTELSASLTT
jgi:glycosyltransferase involved in cell wall biosynthesis